LDYIRMVEIALYLHFPYELVDESLLTFKDAFWNFFEGAEEVGDLMPISHEGYLLK
jgi:hypothetical protein